MAAATFTSATDWMGGWDPKAFFATTVAGKPDPPEGKIYMRGAMIINRYRYGTGITGGTEIGTETTGTFEITNGVDVVTINDGGKKFRCTTDEITPDPDGSGIWKQVQVWEYYSDWQLVDNDTL